MSAQAPSLREIEWKPRYSGETENPLTAFYIPALCRSAAYDRKAGYFSSTALAVAAQGVARLIQNGGKMRLLVGCQLSKEDVEAIEHGRKLKDVVTERLEGRFSDPTDRIQHDRLGALAWMVARGMLEIKVGLPRDNDGKFLPAEAAEGIFHEKVGIFTDAEGNRLVFSGSVNESAQGWLKNLESFHVFRSWARGESLHASCEGDEFETLWKGQGKRTLVLDFPEAMRQKLIQYASVEAPVRDPAEPEDEPVAAPRMAEMAERWMFQFVRDAPFLPSGRLIGEATATLRLWPHQKHVADEVVANYPESLMLCDEVGLGKTIEGGMALKQLLLTRWVRRALLLVPRALIKQWQEELHEKFNLSIPRYDGHEFVDVFDRHSPANPQNPWNTHDVFLATSHLAKRSERQPVLLAARKWDLVLVDEAHHARRAAPTGTEYRANKLLTLLMDLRKRTKGLLLLTATPMQLDVIELWDLLKVVGMGGRWGGGQGQDFRRYFRELKRFPDKAEVWFLQAMFNDYFAGGGEIDQLVRRRAEADIGVAAWHSLVEEARGRGRLLPAQLDENQQLCCTQLFARHTPLRQFMFRSTRDLLKKYQEKSLLSENVPERDVDDVFIPLEEGAEQELYDKIEDYLQTCRQRATSEGNTQLGFVLSIYRRRLTSSLYAIGQSLRRRRDFLLGVAGAPQSGLTDEDLEDEDLDRDATDQLEERPQIDEAVRAEIAYLDGFIEEVERAGVDSKFKRLTRDLNHHLNKHPKVIIFTQYTDTMDYLRDELKEVYGTQIGCYSGRGGETWDGSDWARISKEVIKNRFLEGEKTKILICTDSASEGLNLQTCGLLINYDVSWNPQRVQQRIGRIDRIGQVFPRVTVLNYFYEGTVEAEVYRRLKERMGSFSLAVGPLQPVLARVPALIEDAAFTPKQDRPARLRQLLEELDRQIEQAKADDMKIEDYLEDEPAAIPVAQRPPVTLADIEQLFVGSGLLREEARLADSGDRVYELRTNGKKRQVTFDRDTFDAKPQTLSLLCYGDQLFDEVLARISPPEDTEGLPVVRVEAEQDGVRSVAYFWWKAGAGRSLQEISALAELRERLDAATTAPVPGRPPARVIEEAKTTVRRRLQETLTAQQSRAERRRERFISATQATAEGLLRERLALDYAAELKRAGLEAAEDGIDALAILEEKLAAKRVPYPALVAVVGEQLSELSITHADITRFVGHKYESVTAKLGDNTRRVNALVEEYRELTR